MRAAHPLVPGHEAYADAIELFRTGAGLKIQVLPPGSA